MDPSFQIQPRSLDCANASLYIEISSQGLSYVILSNGVALALTIYNFNDAPSVPQTAEYLQQIIAKQPFLQQKFNSVHIIYSYAASVLLPQEFFDSTDHEAMLELVYGNCNDQIMKSDFMQKYSIHNIYCVPAVIHQVLTRYFSTAKHTHHFSLMPDLVSGQDTYLYCIFSPGQMKAILKKAGKLQAIQLFVYNTPQDAAYYLLNFCQSFEVNVNFCELRLSGMITENSALYKELYKYFLQMQFVPLSNTLQYPKEINNYPSHYFSHLFSAAACV